MKCNFFQSDEKPLFLFQNAHLEGIYLQTHLDPLTPQNEHTH